MSYYQRKKFAKKIHKYLYPKKTPKKYGWGDYDGHGSGIEDDDSEIEYSLGECIKLELENGNEPELLGFFEELKKYSKIVDDRDATEYIKKAEEIKEKFKDSIEKLKETTLKLENTFDCAKLRSHDILPTYKNPSQNSDVEYIKRYGSIEFFEKNEEYGEGDINIEIFNANIGEYISKCEKKYDALREENESQSKYRTKLEKKKAKLEKKLSKKEGMAKGRVQAKIDEFMPELYSMWADLHQEKDTKASLEFLKSITPEQIKVIEEFFKAHEEFKKFPSEECFEIECHVRDIYGYKWLYYHSGTHSDKHTDRKKYIMALEKMFEDGVISDEKMQHIIEKMGEISAKREENAYENNEHSHDKQEIDDDLTKVIDGFLKEIEEEYLLEVKKDDKVITTKEIAETTKQEGITSSEIGRAELLIRQLGKDLFEDKGER